MSTSTGGPSIAEPVSVQVGLRRPQIRPPESSPERPSQTVGACGRSFSPHVLLPKPKQITRDLSLDLVRHSRGLAATPGPEPRELAHDERPEFSQVIRRVVGQELVENRQLQELKFAVEHMQGRLSRLEEEELARSSSAAYCSQLAEQLEAGHRSQMGELEARMMQHVADAVSAAMEACKELISTEFSNHDPVPVLRDSIMSAEITQVSKRLPNASKSDPYDLQEPLAIGLESLSSTPIPALQTRVGKTVAFSSTESIEQFTVDDCVQNDGADTWPLALTKKKDLDSLYASIGTDTWRPTRGSEHWSIFDESRVTCRQTRVDSDEEASAQAT